jgi:salicylate hydroxylase
MPQAIALRAHNRSIIILEQSSLNREIGATISLQPNASKIVEKQWGLGAALKERGSMVDHAFRICSTDGKECKRIDLTSKKEYGGDRVVYHRQDLHSVLKEAATSPSCSSLAAEIQVSRRVISSDCEAGFVTLESGEMLGGFDLIVGADGIRSQIRKSVLGKVVQPVATGVAAYRMMIKASDIEKDNEITKFLDPRDSCTTMVMGHDCRLIMGPARNGEVYSIVAMVPDGKAILEFSLYSKIGN